MRVSPWSAVAFVALAGCDSIVGIRDHDLAPEAGAISGSSSRGGSGSGGTQTDGSASGGGSGGGDDAGSEGGRSSHEDAGRIDASPDAARPEAGACSPGDTLCTSNAPQRCSDAGTWQTLAACSGATPLCFNGTCSAFSITGGILSTGPVPAGGAGIHLVSGGFELGARTCADAGMCVTGGIIP